MKSTKSKMKRYTFIVGGIALIAMDLLLLKYADTSDSFLQVLPFYCIGIGCGAFGYGSGESMKAYALKDNPEIQRMIEIEQKDERNRLIANAAKARAYDVMIYLFAALIICFGLMGMELAPLLMLIAAFLFVEGVMVVQMVKLNKEL